MPTFVASWNVAGWSTTAASIRENFGTVKAFLDKLGADIFCIQEAKIPKRKLVDGAESVWCGAADKPGFPIDGWESFWAFNADRAMNGVTTFARAGLTLRADDAPLREPQLDREGRCIVTYHSHFCVFNVYVPNAQQGQRQAFKTQFQAALLASMRRVRQETGLPIVLVGDLNLSYRTEDCHFMNRKLDLVALEALVRLRRDGEPTEWPADVPPPCNRYPLIKAEWDAVDALLPSIVDHLRSRGSNIPESEARVPAGTSASDDAVEAFLSAMTSGSHVPYMWAESLTRGQVESRHNAHVFVLSECIGQPCHHRDDVRFVRRHLIAEDSMVDTFMERSRRALGKDFCSVPRNDVRHVSRAENDGSSGLAASEYVAGTMRRSTSCSSTAWSDAFDLPFTCWDQYRNKRYENEGNRIDYIFADAVLLPLMDKSRFSDDNAENSVVMAVDRDAGADWRRSEDVAAYCGVVKRRALLRVTEGGRYTAAPMTGSGMEKLRDADRDLQFRGLPRTGLWITPPQYSDHIGVTLYLEGVQLEKRDPGTAVVDAGQCMYRRKSGNLLTMFAKAAARTGHSSPAAGGCEGAAKSSVLVRGNVELQTCATTEARHPKRSRDVDEVVVIDEDD